jgi:hypothetical protein
MAEYILKLKIDQQLEQQSPELVDQIAMTPIGRRNYSFASKYCSWHVPEAYPIYDRYVDELIWAYQKTDKFAEFKRKELKIYPRYKEVIQAFISYYRLTQFSFKEIDKFLWQYGKELFGPNA